jgi:hypothetical protein
MQFSLRAAAEALKRGKIEVHTEFGRDEGESRERE